MWKGWLGIAVVASLVCSTMSLHAQETPTQQDRSASALALLAQAQARFEASDYEEAYGLFEQALGLFQELSQRGEEMRAALYLGHCSYLLWDYQGALLWYVRAYELTWLGLGRGDQAAALQSLGACYRALGDLTRAIDTLNWSLAIFQAIADRASEAETLRLLGHCLSALGDHATAITYHEKSLLISREIASSSGAARSLMDLGGCHLILGQPGEAVERIAQAIALLRELKDRRGEAQALVALGLAYQAMGDYGTAIELCGAALDISRGLADRRGEAESLIALSDSHHALGQYLKAAWLCQEALAALRAIGDRWGEAEVLLRFAECLGAVGSFYQRVEALEQAVGMVENLCPAPDPGQTRMRTALYEGVVHTLFDIGEVEKALVYSERARATSFLDAFEKALFGQPCVLPEAFRPAGRAIQRLVGIHRALRASVFDLGRSAVGPGFAETVRKAEATYHDTLDQLEREDPGLGRLLAVDPQFTARQLERTQAWVENGVVVLAYHVTKDATIAWATTTEGVGRAVKIPLSRDDLDRAVAEFRGMISAPPETGLEMVQYFQALEGGSCLYDSLLGPFDDLIEGATHVVVVPSEVLFSLPFAALYRCPGCEGRDLLKGEYVIERHSISYAPSLASLTLPPLGLGGGVYRSVLAVDPTEGEFLSGEGARRMAGFFPGSTILLGRDATGARVKALLADGRWDLVHLAGGSARLDATSPLCSGLTLVRGHAEDGVLRVSDLLELRPSADLLVLPSSIWVWRGEPEGEAHTPRDELGLAVRALLSSGTASVLLTLGIVADRPTIHLMDAMYGELGAERSKGEALRGAQLAFLRGESGPYLHPYYWAWFVLYGDWRGEGTGRPPQTGKLEYELHRRLEEWKREVHPPDEAPPVVSVLITLSRPVTEADLEAIIASGEGIVVQGVSGRFVQVKVPLPVLEALASLPQVRMVAPPPEAFR